MGNEFLLCAENVLTTKKAWYPKVEIHAFYFENVTIHIFILMIPTIYGKDTLEGHSYDRRFRYVVYKLESS